MTAGEKLHTINLLFDVKTAIHSKLQLILIGN